MAQAFITTYTNNYRWNVQERVKPTGPNNDDIDCDLDESLWMTTEDNVDEGDTENFAKIVHTVKQMQLQRMKSTYQNDYCKYTSTKQMRIEPAIDEELFENQLLESCKILYGRKNQKVLKPLNSSRKINGYIRPRKLFTPLTVYQGDIGRVGFNMLLKEI